jgi:CheY-like chemotaxis protein
VLIVEDDPDVRQALAVFLEAHGYTCNEAGDGAQALTFLRANPAPSVILLDVMMPNMDGLTFRRHQLEDRALAKIPVVVLTARPEDARERVFEGVHWMQKPFRAPELVRIVNDLAAKRSQGRL